jgi:hypothetical protein
VATASSGFVTIIDLSADIDDVPPTSPAEKKRTRPAGAAADLGCNPTAPIRRKTVTPGSRAAKPSDSIPMVLISEHDEVGNGGGGGKGSGDNGGGNGGGGGGGGGGNGGGGCGGAPALPNMEDVDDCVMDSRPSTPLHAGALGAQSISPELDEHGIALVACTGDLLLANLPHLRTTCPAKPFTAGCAKRTVGRNPEACGRCYCYV